MASTAEGWVCKACWKWNRPADERCWRCKTIRDADDDHVEEQRKAIAARAEAPEVVPDAVVAIPVVIFRSYGKVWLRGGIGLFGFLAMMAFGGVTDVLWLALTVGFAVALVACGLAAREVVEGMRNREAWAFVVGLVLSVVGVIGSVTAFQVFAPDLVSPTAVRWSSLIVFGGAGVAAGVGLLMLYRNRPRS